MQNSLGEMSSRREKQFRAGAEITQDYSERKLSGGFYRSALAIRALDASCEIKS